MSTVDVTVYYLQMLSPTGRVLEAAPCAGVEVMHASTPTVRFYRFLFDAVGHDYNWRSRVNRSDPDLAALIQHPQNEVHVLYVEGSPAGFAELDRRQPDEVELVQFGLMPEFIGQRLGKWFLQWTIDRVWSYAPRRFWLHTCTLDHRQALPNYRRAGFDQYDQKQKQETVSDELMARGRHAS